MGHQIGKDGNSLKSKINVLKSMVPSVIGHHKKKRWAVGGQYAHEIKKKKMGI